MRKLSMLNQSLIIRLTVNVDVKLNVAPLVLDPVEAEAVCWLTHRCGRPREEATRKQRTYVWTYRGDGIYDDEKRLLQLPAGEKLLEIDLAEKGNWQVRVRSQTVKIFKSKKWLGSDKICL